MSSPPSKPLGKHPRRRFTLCVPVEPCSTSHSSHTHLPDHYREGASRTLSLSSILAVVKSGSRFIALSDPITLTGRTAALAWGLRTPSAWLVLRGLRAGGGQGRNPHHGVTRLVTPDTLRTKAGKGRGMHAGGRIYMRPAGPGIPGLRRPVSAGTPPCNDQTRASAPKTPLRRSRC